MFPQLSVLNSKVFEALEGQSFLRFLIGYQDCHSWLLEGRA
jgi:hypothetical protein